MPLPNLATWQPGDLATPVTLNAQVRDPSNFTRDTHPRLQVTGYGNQSINNNTWTDVTWDGSIRNSEGTALHSTLSNTHIATIQTAGVYDIRAGIIFVPNTTGRRAIRILLNGATCAHVGVLSSSAAPDGYSITGRNGDTQTELSVMGFQTAGTTFVVQVWQNSGGALNIYKDLTGSHIASWFGLRWIAPS